MAGGSSGSALFAAARSPTRSFPCGDNTLDSIFKRGMKGVYQHCAEKHLHRYLSEFDFRYSNRVALGVHDGERADIAIKGAAGKRLTYRQPDFKVLPFKGAYVSALARKTAKI